MAKVLIVEDDSVMLRLYKKIFTFEKYEVLEATDGASGLQLAKSEKPDVILLDVMMPKMSGYQVLEQLKANPQTQPIPVIVLTNLMSQQDLDSALAKGAERCIVKSQYDPKQVVAMVKEVMGGKEVDGEVEAAQQMKP